MFDYDEESRLAAEKLDKYDFTDILKQCYGVNIFDVKYMLRDLEEEIFDEISDLTTDEFAEYLHQRYGMKIEEVLTTYVWWNDRNGCKNE